MRQAPPKGRRRPARSSKPAVRIADLEDALWLSQGALDSLVYMRFFEWAGPGLVTKESVLRHVSRGGHRASRLEYQRVENLDEVWINW
jgi:hypothetical protein